MLHLVFCHEDGRMYTSDALNWRFSRMTKKAGIGDPAASPPVPPHVAVWRSVRVHGETKTERSRRTLGLPVAAVQALRAWLDCQAGEQLAAGEGWQDTGLVLTTHRGAALDAGNFDALVEQTGLGAVIAASSSGAASDVGLDPQWNGRGR